MEAIRKAEEYIFIETYIIDEGSVLDELLAVLEQKVAEGVDVRLIYDDFGCLIEHSGRLSGQTEGERNKSTRL